MIGRCAGILIPLFSIRSVHDFGRGEFGGLVPMARMALAMGHRLLQLLPIDEVAPGQKSPYSALSVFALDPIYLSPGWLPGIDRAACAAIREEIRRHEPVDQMRLRLAKDALLQTSYRYFKSGKDPKLAIQYQEFTELHRSWLDDYALFKVLKERFCGAEWESWPQPLKDHEPEALAAVSSTLNERLSMLKYVQFVAYQQWRWVHDKLLSWGVFIAGDLAFSPGRESAEVWANRDMFDLDRAVGAPPDAFSAIGQRWGLPKPNWQHMRASNFEFLRRRVRRARELYDVLRIDHVVGLYRTYNYLLDDTVGGEFDPPAEAAQKTQGEEILRIVVEEAGPMQIVAEDLGVIPDFVRETLASFGIPGYKVMRWEKAHTENSDDASFVDPANYPRVSLATTGTHDTDTLVEWWATLSEGERSRLMAAVNRAPTDRTDAVLDETRLDAILEWIYASPAQLVVTPIQDLFGWNARINVPGTTADGNWSWRLPFDLETGMEDLRVRERVTRIRGICERTGRFNCNGPFIASRA
jgi:4-alpha-glucanotransferase